MRIFINLFISLVLLKSSSAFSQDSLAGEYVNLKAEKSGRVGKLLLHPEGAGKYMFSLKLNRGKPSYNSGHLFGELEFKGLKSIYENNDYAYKGKGCKWAIEIKDSIATINTIDSLNKCGMGYGVIVDGQYTLKSSTIPKFYIDSLGNTVEFLSHQ